MTYAALVDTDDRPAASLAGDGLAGDGVASGDRIAVWRRAGWRPLPCSRNGYVYSLSLHRDHTVGDVNVLIDRMRAAALINQPGKKTGPKRAS
jgi:hypothetical protein